MDSDSDSPSTPPAESSKKSAAGVASRSSVLPTFGVAERIIHAVATSKERNGVSLAALKKILKAQGYDVSKYNSRNKTAIKALVTKGNIVQVRGTGLAGFFKINNNKKQQPQQQQQQQQQQHRAKPRKTRKTAKKKPAPKNKKPAAKKATKKATAARRRKVPRGVKSCKKAVIRKATRRAKATSRPKKATRRVAKPKRAAKKAAKPRRR